MTSEGASGGGAVETGIAVGLNAVIVAVTDGEPRVLVIRRADHALASDEPGAAAPQGAVTAETLEALPYGPFLPERHRTLEIGLRAWVSEQTRLALGYAEQLYTFGDRGRDPRERRGGPRVVSVGYLTLVREAAPAGGGEGLWQDWYRYFPWEDWRDGRPAVLDRWVAPALAGWIAASGPAFEAPRRHRAARAFALDGRSWDEELALERYELLYEAGLVREAVRDSGGSGGGALDPVAQPMVLDHRRILATAIGRLRGKIKYRPIIFELLPESFTLLQLQRTVEALAGLRLHKQNFRRFVAETGLVEETGGFELHTGGRPARLFRFRPEVVAERRTPGVRLPASRGSG